MRRSDRITEGPPTLRKRSVFSESHLRTLPLCVVIRTGICCERARVLRCWESRSEILAIEVDLSVHYLTRYDGYFRPSSSDHHLGRLIDGPGNDHAGFLGGQASS